MLAEDEATSSTPTLNRIPAYSLSELFNECKKAGADLNWLAQKYSLEPQTLERLIQVVNSPSISAQSAQTQVDANGDEFTIYKVCLLDIYVVVRHKLNNAIQTGCLGGPQNLVLMLITDLFVTYIPDSK
jgi:hypothetical protein